MAKLTVHVLDMASGESAHGLKIDVEKLDGMNSRLCLTASTARNGRTDTPLLEDAKFSAGQYKLRFYTAEYFAKQGIAMAKPRFLETVTVEFNTTEGENYHIPLLITPWSYSVYRGS